MQSPANSISTQENASNVSEALSVSPSLVIKDPIQQPRTPPTNSQISPILNASKDSNPIPYKPTHPFEKFNNMNQRQGPIRNVRSMQDEAFTRHSRARSYGSSLLDCLNDRAYGSTLGYPPLPNSNNPNLIQQTQFMSNRDGTLLDDSSNPQPNFNEDISQRSDADFNFSTTKISNESIFGLPPGLDTPPPPGLDDPFTSQKPTNVSLGAPTDSLPQNSNLLRGSLSGTYYKPPFYRRHGGSMSVSLSRAKAALYGSKLGSDLYHDPSLNPQNGWSLDYSAPIKSSLSAQDSSRIYYPRDGDVVPPVPPIPDLSTLKIQTSPNNEVDRGNSAPRDSSISDSWDIKKNNENSLHGYTFGNSSIGTDFTNSINNNLNMQNESQNLFDDQRTHIRSRTFGNSLETLSSGLYGNNPQISNDLRGYLGRMGHIDPNNFPNPTPEYNSKDFISHNDYNDQIDNGFLPPTAGRHLRQASMGFLGIGHRLGSDKIPPSFSMTNLAAAPRSDEDFHLSNFSSIGRAGTSSLLHGIRAAGSHHASSLSVSGSIGAPYESSPTRSLWVGNLDLSVTPRELIEVFGKFGRIESLRTLPDKECAFINFMRLEDAMRAHDEMQNGFIKNSAVRVGYGKGEGYATSDAQAMQPTRALWIGNISANTTPASLRKLFETFGVVESARILGQKSCGFVNFERIEDAVRAKQATNGKELDGMVVRIGYAKVPVRGSEGFSRPRNQVPNAPPLTVSGRIAEANAIVGTSSSGLGSEDVLEPGVPVMDEVLVAFQYATSIPPLPLPNSQLMPGQTRLRELRKRLDSNCPQNEFNSIFDETIGSMVDLCTDYVGNMLVQRLVERGSFDQKMKIIKAVAPHISSIGTHKNGTWAIQKIIDSAKDREHQEVIVEATRPYVPQLLLDQLGNYVAQCCLAFPENRNQFIFDSIHARSWDIAQGRFGARAIRTCLENSNTTRAQQKLVAVVLVLNAVSLSTNANGNILISWLLDSSNFPGRFRVVAPQLAGHLRHLCTHKLGSSTILKIINQREEPDARDLIINTLFFNPEHQVLDDILSDQVHGANVVLNVLTCDSVDDSEKVRIAHRIKSSLIPFQMQGIQGYQCIYEVVDSILSSNQSIDSVSDQGVNITISNNDSVSQDGSSYCNSQGNNSISQSPGDIDSKFYGLRDFSASNSNGISLQSQDHFISSSMMGGSPSNHGLSYNSDVLNHANQNYIGQQDGVLSNKQISNIDQKVYY
ncbi:Pumilio domain-containing protein [Smittium mucronatum]|uniref:Pumilio domain-containing protein n=1 Tax=Smittium mucronatum TaxID=133383 RepID=A0A1R0H0R0_9FUNG|nr:Pumilio domain-containing protein [Smittium mucronatum]